MSVLVDVLKLLVEQVSVTLHVHQSLSGTQELCVDRGQRVLLVLVHVSEGLIEEMRENSHVRRTA